MGGGLGGEVYGCPEVTDSEENKKLCSGRLICI